MSRHLKIVTAEDLQPDPPVVLEIEDLCKTFSSAGNGDKSVLNGVGFNVRHGELICILGRSGCGKTTLLNLFAGFISPTAGQIKLNNRIVRKPGPERGVIFQEDALFPWLTVRENIAFGLKGRRSHARQREREIDHYLDLVGLSEFATYLPSEISGGMKQRVSLARVLILQPQVLLMDEPFAALDAQTREEMQSLLLDLWRQLSHTILFVTHDVTEAVTLADRVILLDKETGSLKGDIPIDIPRPREKSRPGFINRCREIRDEI